MAVFLLKSKHGSAYVPPACAGVFATSPARRLFADWIEQLARRRDHGGCGEPATTARPPVTRAQMAVVPAEDQARLGYVPPPCAGRLRRRGLPEPLRRLDRAARGRGDHRRLRRRRLLPRQPEHARHRWRRSSSRRSECMHGPTRGSIMNNDSYGAYRSTTRLLRSHLDHRTRALVAAPRPGRPISSLSSFRNEGQTSSRSIAATDGNFYGTTYWGGSSGVGTIFRIDDPGGLETVHSFGYPTVLTSRRVSSGSRRQLLRNGQPGGTHNLGTVFRMDPSGHVTRLHSFDGVRRSDPVSALSRLPTAIFTAWLPKAARNTKGQLLALPPPVNSRLHHFSGKPSGSSPCQLWYRRPTASSTARPETAAWMIKERCFAWTRRAWSRR